MKTKVTAHFGSTGIAQAMVRYGTRAECEQFAQRHPEYRASYSVTKNGDTVVNLVRIGRELGNASHLNP